MKKFQVAAFKAHGLLAFSLYKSRSFKFGEESVIYGRIVLKNTTSSHFDRTVGPWYFKLFELPLLGMSYVTSSQSVKLGD